MQDRRNEDAVKSLNRSAVRSVHAFVRALSENADRNKKAGAEQEGRTLHKYHPTTLRKLKRTKLARFLFGRTL
jgi:hypothetical protein